MTKRTRISVVFIALAAAILVLVFTVASTATGVELTIGDLIADAGTFESRSLTLEGVLNADSVAWDSKAIRTSFDISDDDGNVLPVVYEGVRPDGFYEGVSVIVSGRYDVSSGRFLASKLQTRCPSRYEGPPTSDSRLSS